MNKKNTQKVFIKAGEPIGIIGGGDGRCHREDDTLVVPPDEHWGNPVFGDAGVDDRDFHIHAKLSLGRLAGDGASILLGGDYLEHWSRPEGSHAWRICLDEDVEPIRKSMHKQMRIVHGRTHPREAWFPADDTSDKQIVGVSSDFFCPGEPFTVDIVRHGSELTFAINDREVFRACPEDLGLSGAESSGAPGRPISVGFLPGRGTLRIHEFHAGGALPGPLSPTTDVWQLNTGGYSHYRTPALCMTSGGRLLAFAEARRSYLSRGWEWCRVQDIELLSGEIHCALKWSDDNGKTWSEQKIVIDQGNTYEARCPSPLLEPDTGELFLFINGAWLLASQNDGQSWSGPRTLNGSLPGNWRSGNMRSILPGTANSTVQLQHGQFKGRLLVAFYLQGVIGLMVSDDHGKTWLPGATVAVDMGGDPAVVELADGRVLVSPRVETVVGAKLPGRPVLISHDGGLTLGAIHHQPALPISGHGAMLAVDLPNAGPAGKRRAIVFCGSAAQGSCLELKISMDDGESWPIATVIDAGATHNVALVALPNGQLGVLYERDECRRLSFQQVDLAGLVAGCGLAGCGTQYFQGTRVSPAP